ncbi:uncharacterized protein [Littorina saxatilis]|uniref:Uncharacterized protein n=1 Tax=Littorina saxatilis TaxID=31220 RepID=A0AAN9GMN1_9CAEN
MLEVVTVLAVLVASSHRGTCLDRSPRSDAPTRLFIPLLVPDQNYRTRLRTYRFSNILLTHFSSANERRDWLVFGLRRKWSATNAAVVLRSYWWARLMWVPMIPVGMIGTINISASEIHFNATMTVGRDSRGTGFMELTDCKSTVDHVDLNVQSGDWVVTVADWLLDFETIAKDLIPKAVCEHINDTINHEFIWFGDG